MVEATGNYSAISHMKIQYSSRLALYSYLYSFTTDGQLMFLHCYKENIGKRKIMHYVKQDLKKIVFSLDLAIKNGKRAQDI